jgi:type III pantothenate kinase
MILVIDAGNTRLKWAWLTSTGLSNQQAIVHRNAKSSSWSNALFDGEEKPTRILVSNVAGPKVAKVIERMSRKKFRIEAEFIVPTARFGELTNAYADPSKLGVDRWLTIIAAWSRAKTGLCVIDVGTAVTVDGVDNNGQHLGGLIIPGIHMMREELLSKTSDIAGAAQQGSMSLGGIFAASTVGAVSRGAVFAISGLADRAVEAMTRGIGAPPKVFITGGDASTVAPAIRGEIVPDLVLHGLAAIAAQTGEVAR